MCELRVFFFQDWLPYQDQNTQYTLLFTHTLKENGWMHTFLTSMSTMWNANSLIQDLNLGRCIHFYNNNYYTTSTPTEFWFELRVFLSSWLLA